MLVTAVIISTFTAVLFLQDIANASNGATTLFGTLIGVFFLGGALSGFTGRAILLHCGGSGRRWVRTRYLLPAAFVLGFPTTLIALETMY